MLAILQPSAPSPPWPLASQGESRQLMPSDSSLARSTGNTQWQDCYLMAPDYSGHSRPWCRGGVGLLGGLGDCGAGLIKCNATKIRASGEVNGMVLLAVVPFDHCLARL